MDISGKTYGRLKVLQRVGLSGNRQIKWKCLCVCGTEKVVRADSLKNGHTTSCGGYNKEQVSKSQTKHGLHGTSEYAIWNTMVQRCTNNNAENYHNYGGRGICVCDEWKKSFETFFKDMGPRPSLKHSIDRINNDGNYEPGNCQWSTKHAQDRNKRTNVWIEYNGKRYVKADLCKELNLNPNKFEHQLRLGKTVDEAVKFVKILGICINLTAE